MTTNNGGYYDSSHGQAQQFRRATARVDMGSTAASHYQPQQMHNQQLQYAQGSPKQQQQQQPVPQQPHASAPHQYAGPSQPALVSGHGSSQHYGKGGSAIPAPHDYRQHPAHQARPPHQGYLHAQAQHQPPPPPPQHFQQHPQQQHHFQQQQQQQQQHHYVPQNQPGQVQYQNGNQTLFHQHQQVQRVADAGWSNEYSEDSEESLDLYSHHQRSQQRQQQRQQQQEFKPAQSMSTDSAIQNSSYAGTPTYSTETANAATAHSSLTDDFRRLGIGSGPDANASSSTASGQTLPRPTPPVPRKNVSSEALRRREQKLEDEYDNDDGIAGVEVDTSLFPNNPRQVAQMGRSEKYGSPANIAPHTTSSPPIPTTGKTTEPTPTPTSTTTHCPTAASGSPDSGVGGVMPDFSAPAAHSNESGSGAPETTNQSAGDLAPELADSSAKPQPKLPLLLHHPHFAEQRTSSQASPRPARAFAGSADAIRLDARQLQQRLAKSSSLSKLRPEPALARQRSRRQLAAAGEVEPKAERLLRRRPSQSLQRLSRTKSTSASPALYPLPPHWSKCTRSTPSSRALLNSSNHTTATTTTNGCPSAEPSTSIVARNPALAIENSHPNMSRNASPHSAQLPVDFAQSQRFHGNTIRGADLHTGVNSVSTTNNSSPVYAGRPYANDNGFDSSSDRLAANVRHNQQQYQQSQYPPQQSHQRVYSAPYYADPHDHSGPVGTALPYAQPQSGPPSYQGQANHSLPPPGSHGQHIGSGSFSSVPAESNYSHSSSGDALIEPDLAFLPQPGMRPWANSSSKSLPMAGTPAQQLAERDAASSRSSSAVGVAPMVNMPSAKVIGVSPLAKPPPPTMASLEAYRASIRRSSDPAAQLEFAKYVLDHAHGMADQEGNPKLAMQRFEMLTSEGFKWIKKLAGGGITVHRSNIAAEAQFFLGTAYSQGSYGVQKDDTKAFAYYQQASKAQHAEANYRTAVCYEIGMGTRRDPARAMQFYRKAAAQTNVPAMYKLGMILIKGKLGVTAAPREGITWLKRGADNATPECPHSLHELALCYESTSIPEIIPDESYSRELYIKAGKLGYRPSQVRLGQAYEYGTLGCAVDPRKSIGWYTRAAEQEDPDAELALSGWYLTGAEPILPQNDVEAFLWARRAAGRRLAKAEYAVGYYYECGIGVAQPDLQEAQSWYGKAALQGNRRAISRLRELKQMGVHAAGAGNKMSRPRRSKEGSLF